MKLSNELNSALNEQVIMEYQNQMRYKEIEAWFETQQLHHLARYFHEQANDEKSHASAFQNYIYSRTGGDITLGQEGNIVIQNLNPKSVGDVADAMVKAEEATTESIEGIYNLALDEKSFMDLPFLSHFLKIQVEEESDSNNFATRLRNVKDIVLFDKMIHIKK